ncbi:MAG: hypothetical protein ACLUPV_01865 [Bilophila wadsworthia]
MTIAYRRTRKEMPADIEEIEAALDEGVRIVELCALRKSLPMEAVFPACAAPDAAGPRS